MSRKPHSIRSKKHLLLYIVFGVLLLAVLGFFLRGINQAHSASLDILSTPDWNHFAGAQKIGNTVKVFPLDRKIVNQDGTGGQPNPPVNVRGPRLIVDGNFKIAAAVSSLDKNKTGYLYFYSQPPIIYDEWRYEPAHLRLGFSRNKIELTYWDGKSDNPTATKSWAIEGSQKAQVTLNVTNAEAWVFNYGSLLGGMPVDNVFSAKTVWFGADAIGGSWTLNSLRAEGASNIIPGVAIKMRTNTNQSLSGHGQKAGAAVASYALFTDEKYRNLVAGQFNMLTPENELKAQFVHPQPEVYSFTDADSLVEFAKANGMSVHGHNLVFSEANPKWMQESQLNDRQQIMTNHIGKVVSHFGSNINEWDVVDEPLSDEDANHGNSSDLRQNIWTAAMGEQYIDQAFNTAHQANPNAVLYINEYGLEADGSRWDEFLALIKRLQSRRVPVQGVGFQAHVYEPGDEVDGQVLRQHIQTLADMGLVARISEADVYGDDPAHQASQYAAILQACLSEPSCKSFTAWGVTDRYGSTTESHTYPLQYGNDLIWDENYKPKPAYQSLENVLRTANF